MVLTCLNAQNYNQLEFTGQGDGYSWEDPENWRRGGDPNLPGYPEPNDDILIEGFNVYFNGLGTIPLNQEYGTLELRFGANLSTQGDFNLTGDFIVDPSSTFEAIIRDIDEIYTVTCQGNYFFNGTMQINFSGYVPQIGNTYQIINGFQGSCSTPTTVLSMGDGFEATLGAQCEFEGLSYVVTDINYTTAISWDGEGNDGLWRNPANWDPNGIPPVDSTIIINLPATGGYVITDGAGITDAHTIYIGRNNTLEVNGDLLLNKYIYLSKEGTLSWKGGKIYGKDPNEQSGMISYGHLNIDGPGLKELDTNFNIWNYFEDINHNQGNLNINNGVIRMFNFNSYNINSDNITIGYNSGNLHELTISVVSELNKTTGNGTSSIDLTTFINYGKINSKSGTLAINGDLETGTFQEYIDGQLKKYVGTYGGKGLIKFPTNFVMDGVVAPGSSPGILTVVDDFTTSSLATFDIEIDGQNAGTQYDQVLVTGNATLEGVINVTLGYLPANTASFAILTASNLVSCNFPAQVYASYNGTPFTFDVSCQNNTLYLNGPGATLSTPLIEASELDIYPNPVADLLTIKLSKPAAGNWSIYNQIGQQVLNGNLTGSETQLSVNSLAKGIYVLQIKDENNISVKVKKIIISN